MGDAAVVRLLRKLPTGHGLSAQAWAPLHRFFLVLLWLHVPGVAAFGLVFEHSISVSLSAAACLLPLAVLSGVSRIGRRAQSVVASLGLGMASGLLVHLSGGYIELHFHYFVMVTLLMRSVSVEIDRRWVKPVGGSPKPVRIAEVACR